MNINLRKNFFFIILLLAIIVVALISYNRFMVERDYIASYEGFCDPYEESCFWICEDDDCNEIFYYTIVEKHASGLYDQCGLDVSVCDDASICFPEDRHCSITYCDPELDGDSCEHLSRGLAPAVEVIEGEEVMEEVGNEGPDLPETLEINNTPDPKE